MNARILIAIVSVGVASQANSAQPGRAVSASGDGWLVLRWGMSPEQARARLSDPKGLVRATAAPDCSKRSSEEWSPIDTSCLLKKADHDFALFGVKPNIVLKFSASQLHTVRLTFFNNGPPPDTERALATKLKQALEEKYGPAIPSWQNGKTSYDTELVSGTVTTIGFSWTHPNDLHISLNLTEEDQVFKAAGALTFASVVLQYTDIDRLEELNNERLRALQESKAREAEEERQKL